MESRGLRGHAPGVKTYASRLKGARERARRIVAAAHAAVLKQPPAKCSGVSCRARPNPLRIRHGIKIVRGHQAGADWSVDSHELVCRAELAQAAAVTSLG